MFPSLPRRRFLQTIVGSSALIDQSGLPFMGRLPQVSAQEAQVNPASVRFSPEIEPLVRFTGLTFPESPVGCVGFHPKARLIPTH